MKKNYAGRICIHLFFVLFSLAFIIPFLYILSISLTEENTLVSEGYRLFASKLSLSAYRYVFANPAQILNSYAVTVFSSFGGTLISVLMMSLGAYPLARDNFIGKRAVTFFIFFTMLFNGGLIPTYILMTKYLNLGNSIWIYFTLNMASAYYILILRTFFKQLPASLMESAQIDGASEFKIYFRIILPISKPVIATVSLMMLLAKWNDWNTSLIYARDARLYTLQFLLQRILRETEFLNSVSQNIPIGFDITETSNAPFEGMRFAMCVIAAGPMLIIFPFFQKYFAGGLTIGAVKG